MILWHFLDYFMTIIQKVGKSERHHTLPPTLTGNRPECKIRTGNCKSVTFLNNHGMEDWGCLKQRGDKSGRRTSSHPPPHVDRQQPGCKIANRKYQLCHIFENHGDYYGLRVSQTKRWKIRQQNVITPSPPFWQATSRVQKNKQEALMKELPPRALGRYGPPPLEISGVTRSWER